MNFVTEKLSQTYHLERCPSDGSHLLNGEKNEPLWHKLVDDHLLLNMEFSLLCQQIRDNLFLASANKNTIDRETLKEQLQAACYFAEILEGLYDGNRLNVPREVRRLQNQRRMYLHILNKDTSENLLKIGLSLVDKIRENTFRSNLYRLLVVRSRGFLDAIRTAGLGSLEYVEFVAVINKYAIPFFRWLAWIFFLPRLFVNLFTLFKNTFYTSNMSREHLDLGYFERFLTQFKRRWFHLGNDVVWVAVGLLNCFLLIGALLPIATYVAFAAFIYDVVLAVIALSIEMYRLMHLKNHYAQMNPTAEINQYQDYINDRILFEAVRLSLNIVSTSVIVLAAFLALPLFASITFMPLIGATLLVVISLAAFFTNMLINEWRPKEVLDDKEVAMLSSKIGFFARKKQEPAATSLDETYDSSTSAISTNI